MNYLAHIYLSYENDAIKIGNFISDFIRGNKYKHLPISIQKGILLHRKIDSFTDNHSVVKQSKRRLDKQYGHYTGVIIDILYDHFLAKNWKQFSNTSLMDYEKEFIELLVQNKAILPEKVLNIIPYLSQQHWISSYATIEGISKTLVGVNKRTNGVSKMNLAINDLQDNYMELEKDFFLFFNDLQQYVTTLKKEFV